jgi:DNA-binding transcriptional ArsR family regulator
MESVFRALADPSRRALLDALFMEDGQSLSALCRQLDISRQAVSKHLRILETAGLVLTHFEGREKFHYLNAIPIQEIGDRWIAKYSEQRAAAVTALKESLEA